MDLAHHLDRSQRCLDWVPVNLAAGDCARAAESLGKAASHAVTAAAVHWGYPYKSRRRLTTVLYGLLRDSKIAHASHIRTFRQVHELPAQIAAASDAEARRLIRRVRTRVRRLRKAIVAAVNTVRPAPDSDSNSNPPRKSAASLRAQLEAIAITRPEIRSWIHLWPDLFGDPPPASHDSTSDSGEPPAHEPPEWPNPPSVSGPGFRWPLPRALPWPAPTPKSPNCEIPPTHRKDWI